MTLSISTDSPQFANILMVAGIVLITVMLLISIRRKLNRSKPKSIALDHEQRLDRGKQVMGMKDDLRTMMVELEDLTRRFSAQLDAKTVKLEKLLREADQRIAQLNGKADVSNSNFEFRASNLNPVANSKSESSKPTPVNVSPDPLARSVYELADAGNDPQQIARRLSEHVGKIELILALRQH